MVGWTVEVEVYSTASLVYQRAVHAAQRHASGQLSAARLAICQLSTDIWIYGRRDGRCWRGDAR